MGTIPIWTVHNLWIWGTSLTKLAKNDEGIGATLFLPLTPTVGVQDAPREFGGTVRAAGEPARAGSCRGSGGPGTRIVARPPKENSVLAKGVEEVQGLFRFSRTHRVPMTFRAAGTSLSGQAVTDGILVEVSRHWREMRVEEGGRKVRVQPGVIGGHVNQALKAYRAKMGPDPASIAGCVAGSPRTPTTRFIPSPSSFPPAR